MRDFHEFDTSGSSTVQRAAIGFAKGVPWRQLPLYVGMAILLGVTGILAIAMLSHHGGTKQEAETISVAIRMLVYLYTGIPLACGIVSLVREVRGGGS